MEKLGRGKPTGSIPAGRRLTAHESLIHSLRTLFPDREWDESSDILELLRLIYFGDMKDSERAQALIAIMKFTRPTLRSTEFTANVTEVQVQLSPDDIKGIIAADPFKAAIEVKSEP